MLEHLSSFFGKERQLTEVTPVDIEGYKVRREAEVSGSTVNRAHTNFDSKRAAVEKLDGFGDNLVTVHSKMHQSRAVLSLNRRASYNVSRT
jgi:hypothetical protein